MQVEWSGTLYIALLPGIARGVLMACVDTRASCGPNAPSTKRQHQHRQVQVHGKDSYGRQMPAKITFVSSTSHVTLRLNCSTHAGQMRADAP